MESFLKQQEVFIYEIFLKKRQCDNFLIFLVKMQECKEDPSLKPSFFAVLVHKIQLRFKFRPIRKQYFKTWIDFYPLTGQIKEDLKTWLFLRNRNAIPEI